MELISAPRPSGARAGLTGATYFMRARTIQRWVAAAILGCTISMSAAAAPAVPPTITNQGRLFGADDKPINGKLDVVFAIYDAADATTPLWSEQQSITF